MCNQKGDCSIRVFMLFGNVCSVKTHTSIYTQHTSGQKDDCSIRVFMLLEMYVL